MKRIGIDFGASYTDAVVFAGGRVEKTFSVTSDKFASSLLLSEFSGELQEKGVVFNVTGSRKEKKDFLKIAGAKKVKQVDEIKAIARGAVFLSGKKRFLTANVGTGTPLVFVDGEKHEHLGGTGLGGGTLEGLAKLLLKEKVENIEALARRGKNSLDLTVGDILGAEGIGMIPSSATASNFGKATRASKPKREDVARSVLFMVAESIGVAASLAAGKADCGEIVFTGRTVAMNGLFRQRLAETARMFGKKALFPPRAEYCTAIGAALV